MRLRHKKILLTGKPGVGKTTIIHKVVERLTPSVKMAGFLTAEIRSQGTRVGFELRGLNGESRTLAHLDIESRDRVGRYGVDTCGFEEFLRQMELSSPGMELVVIDEIGKMELFSSRFKTLVLEVVGSEKQLLATIALKGDGFIRKIKQRPEIHLLEVTISNRDYLPEEIISDRGTMDDRSPAVR